VKLDIASGMAALQEGLAGDCEYFRRLSTRTVVHACSPGNRRRFMRMMAFFAHDRPDLRSPISRRSRANVALVSALAELPELQVRSLYELYPDFAIDIEAEQSALLAARIVLWQCPLYWYSVPPLLKLWFDKVLAYGWAYGEGTHALARQTLSLGRDERR